MDWVPLEKKNSQMCRLVTINSWSLWALYTAAQSCYLLWLSLLLQGLLPTFTACLRPLNGQPLPSWSPSLWLRGINWDSLDQTRHRPNFCSLLSLAQDTHSFLLLMGPISPPPGCYSTWFHEQFLLFPAFSISFSSLSMYKCSQVFSMSKTNKKPDLTISCLPLPAT